MPGAGFTPAGLDANVRLAWVSTTGPLYQVQYKTNLLQPSWSPVSQPFFATNYNAILWDSNVLSAWPRRFYRLMVLP